MSPPRRALLAVGIALLSALFFTTTYVLNRAAAVEGGHWAWTAALRYLFTLPLLLPLMPWQGGVSPVVKAIRAAPGAWLLWSGIGFVLFYVLLSYAAASGPSWLVAASFQTTVVAGMVCAPLLYRDARARIPRAALAVGVLIVAGVLLMQLGHAHGALDATGWIALLCVVASAFAYPLGNRGLLLHLERSGIELNASQRVFGLTLASQPAWIALAVFAWTQAGPPSTGQLWLTAGVALSAGVIATILFFQATGMVRDNATALGAAEAMQAAEVLFAVLLGVAFLGEAWPRGQALCGALLIVAGIVLFAWIVARDGAREPRDVQALRSERGG
ncbi:multidrug resistance efflux transporter family protein [Thermomonas sp. HDW16]|uniref:multidrug resistance efflux transporter family protein n=1 Tax=Thermomonas sp. HDW16 TaxID=2714945 RepID=UPI00140B7761|nr:multidrug resistance efflux transporter family protein [Thermomonas sp. HDW16]QIL19498.1 multidrug resistance efflux transporter family protein [Thermomonas sp. HDW16]